MGKMKELFMKIHYPHGDLDIEREWLIDNSLKQEQEYLEYQKLIQDPEIQSDQTKIEVHGTRIEIHRETEKDTEEIKDSEFEF